MQTVVAVAVAAVLVGVRFVAQAVAHVHDVDFALVLRLGTQFLHVVVPTFGRFARRFRTFAVAVSELRALGRFRLALVPFFAGGTPARNHVVRRSGIPLPAAVVIGRGRAFDGQTLQGFLRGRFGSLQALVHSFMPFLAGYLPIAAGVYNDRVVSDAMLETFAGLYFPLLNATFNAFVHFAQASVDFGGAAGHFVLFEAIAQLAQIEIFQMFFSPGCQTASYQLTYERRRDDQRNFHVSIAQLRK
jgi:hypothetical protein